MKPEEPIFKKMKTSKLSLFLYGAALGATVTQSFIFIHDTPTMLAWATATVAILDGLFKEFKAYNDAKKYNQSVDDLTFVLATKAKANAAFKTTSVGAINEDK